MTRAGSAIRLLAAQHEVTLRLLDAIHRDHQRLVCVRPVVKLLVRQHKRTCHKPHSVTVSMVGGHCGCWYGITCMQPLHGFIFKERR